MTALEWLRNLPKSGRALPILSSPAATLLGVTVGAMTQDAEVQARAMLALAERYDSAAAVSMMDLSVEAEAFGCRLRTTESEIPTVVGALLADADDLESLRVPEVGDARTGIYLEAVARAKALIHDRPVLAGMIGPFSLAGRLMDVSEALVNCIVEPEFVHATLERTTEFLIRYAKAYKSIGTDGIVLAEPLAGLLSAEMESEFGASYGKQVVDAVQDEHFVVIYHNCGPNVAQMMDSLTSIEAAGYHFGDAVDLGTMLSGMPPDRIVLGNLSPVQVFCTGTPDTVYAETARLIDACKGFSNFVLSSGCDLPPSTPIENIDAFFRARREFVG